MAKTVVGLFENPALADAAVCDLEAGGFTRENIRIVSEPRDLAVTDMMSTPHMDFEVDLTHELRDLGASDKEADACVEGVRRKGALVLATGSEAMVASATEIMSRHAGAEVESLSSGDLHLPSTVGESEKKIGAHDASVQAGRARASGGGPQVFRW